MSDKNTRTPIEGWLRKYAVDYIDYIEAVTSGNGTHIVTFSEWLDALLTDEGF